MTAKPTPGGPALLLVGLPAYAVMAGATAALGSPMTSVAALLPLFAALLWLLPDQDLVSPRRLAAAFAVMIAAQLCVPSYYMLQIHGLPWISLRRVAMAALLLSALLRLATCAGARARIGSALGAAPLALALNVGFDVMAGLSILASQEPSASLQSFSDAMVNWRLPFLACLLVIGDEVEGAKLVRLIGALSLIVAAIGVADFFAQRNFTLQIFPQRLLAAMAANNPGIQILLDYDPWRNGYFRALSIYITPLSFGEFAALCGPLGGFLVLHGEGMRDRALGLAVVGAAMASLFVSGSRGGAVGFLVSMLLFGLVFVIRLWRTRARDSFAAPVATIVAAMAGGAAVTAVVTWRRLSNIVFGGGDSVSSTAARAEQLAMAWPHIFDSPFFGNGLGLGSAVLNWRPAPDQPASIDSYLVSLLIETGFPGAFFYFGAIAAAAGACLVIYLRDRDPRAALAAPIGCSLIAYGLYRLVLSQRENQTLVFILLALAFLCVRGATERRRGSRA
jgi:O-antigen ligase